MKTTFTKELIARPIQGTDKFIVMNGNDVYAYQGKPVIGTGQEILQAEDEMQETIIMVDNHGAEQTSILKQEFLNSGIKLDEMTSAIS